MNWKTLLAIGVGVALTVFGIWTTLSRHNETTSPQPVPTITLPAPGTATPSTTTSPTPDPDVSSATATPEGEDYGDIPAADIERAKQQARSFLQAIETYGPNVTVEQALRNAVPYMDPEWAEEPAGDDPIDDAEYAQMVGAGKTRVIDVQKLFVTSGSRKSHRIVMVASIRTGWIPAATSALPADQPTYQMVVQLSGTVGGTWTVSDYLPSDS